MDDFLRKPVKQEGIVNMPGIIKENEDKKADIRA